jgi:hypothetical protein
MPFLMSDSQMEQHTSTLQDYSAIIHAAGIFQAGSDSKLYSTLHLAVEVRASCSSVSMVSSKTVY